MKELLTSNGLTNTIGKTLLNISSKPPEQMTVGFITTAAFGENDPTWRNEWLEEHRNQLRKIKITKIEDVDLEKKTRNQLSRYFPYNDFNLVRLAVTNGIISLRVCMPKQISV